MIENQQNNSPKPTIGWREWLVLPDLAIPAIKAKIDTGARTSALHTHSLEAFEDNGVTRVRFTIHPLRKRPSIELRCTADVSDRRFVTDSGGHRELRYFIKTLVSVGRHTWPVELSLTNRDNMIFRMLLGRTALSDRFIVDPGASYLTGRRLAKVYPKRPRRKT